jgi:hypothetical protein
VKVLRAEEDAEENVPRAEDDAEENVRRGEEDRDVDVPRAENDAKENVPFSRRVLRFSPHFPFHLTELSFKLFVSFKTSIAFLR